MIDIKELYIKSKALLEGHFLLSSGKHSRFYLQSARLLENPKIAELLANNLAEMIKNYGIVADSVCSPALGGILAGYELARALGVRFIFTERVQGEMLLRRGFEVKEGERFIICEDVITTGGSALEVKNILEKLGAKVVAFSALANRGVCKRIGNMGESKKEALLPSDIPLFALADFDFEVYDSNNCPLCKDGSKPIKPGSRGN